MDTTLNPRQESFCRHYTTIGSETFFKRDKGCTAAEYAESSAAVTATTLLRREAIRKRIIELHAENMSRNMITVDKILADLEHDKLLARQNHQYAVSKGCTELQGRYLAMFKDRQMLETSDEIKEMDEHKREEARRLAVLSLQKIG